MVNSTEQQAARVPINRSLAETGMVAILRLSDTARLGGIVDALVDAGVRCLELTMTTDRALELVGAIVSATSVEVEVGVGTVTSGRDAVAAIEAGARFIVSPCVEPEVIAEAVAAGVPVYPGALTPTEVLAAWRAGASAVKLFPAVQGGPDYVGQIRGPLPNIPLVPTGGIDMDNAAAYMRAGCVAIGVGGPLIGDSWKGGSLTELGDRARSYLRAISEIRTAHD